MPELRQAQLQLAAHLRDPARAEPPPGVEERRLQVYRDLVFNNIEGFLRKGFPVLHSLYSADSWRALVRDFIREHPSRSPYFLEISQEFLAWLMQSRAPAPGDPPFMRELAHYEWVELALDVAEDELPPAVDAPADPGQARLLLSPLAWLLAYAWPVHLIGPACQPAEAGEPVYLLVWRDRALKVAFMVLNPVAARLLELCRDEPGRAADTLLAQLATEMAQPLESLREAGLRQLSEFIQRDIVLVEG